MRWSGGLWQVGGIRVGGQGNGRVGGLGAGVRSVWLRVQGWNGLGKGWLVV